MASTKLLPSAASLRHSVATAALGLADKSLAAANTAFAHVPLVKTVTIAKDLAEVTTAGKEVDAESLGLNADCADAIWHAVQGLYRSATHNHIGLCIRREGKILVNRSIGTATGEYGSKGAKVGSVDTPACLYSASKAISALLLCKLEELGQLSLSDTISQYIPQFARHGKQDITLAELISHQAKIPSFNLQDPRLLTDHDYMLDHLCDTVPSDAKQAYHAITGGFIIAEVIERVTGQPIQTALDTHFRKPLGMKYFTYGLEPKYRKHHAVSHTSGLPMLGPMKKIPHMILGMQIEEVVELANSDPFFTAALPAANIFATAEECSRFYQMLLNNGEYNGQQVLAPATIRKARGGDFLPNWDATFNIPAHFSRGGFMLNSPPTFLFGLNAPKAYGHLGFINVLTWADPQRDLAVGLVSSGKPFIGPHLLSFANIPNAINHHCPKL